MAVMTAAVPAAGASGSPSVPHYDHIFLIVEENHGFADVIGNTAAPNLNALVNRFGLATQYFGVAHPSEPNYVALMGGNTFGIANDDPYYFDGKTWSVVATPNIGADFKTLFGVAAKGGKAWAVGVRLNSDFQDRALIEAWDGAHWTIADSPQPGSERNILFGASATSTSDVWAVGDQEGSNGRFQTLVEHFDGTRWSVVPSANPGTTDNHLYGVKAVGPEDVWAVGQQVGASGPDHALSCWSLHQRRAACVCRVDLHKPLGRHRVSRHGLGGGNVRGRGQRQQRAADPAWRRGQLQRGQRPQPQWRCGQRHPGERRGSRRHRLGGRSLRHRWQPADPGPASP